MQIKVEKYFTNTSIKIPDVELLHMRNLIIVGNFFFRATGTVSEEMHLDGRNRRRSALSELSKTI